MRRAIIRGYSFVRYSHYLPELCGWLSGLLALAFMKPDAAHLFSLCPFSYVLEWCPGCGLGHAVAWLFRGEVVASWEAHPLGVPAIVLLFYRCVYLVRQHLSAARLLTQTNTLNP
ncbi:DUF2752 domain-containing protein [Pontibacter sp. Tf4]|uniref:DUF2752 domain-containing protein n=1 Tax=Pontibacter sp. Tf4 TaxID=2761620 RepID=UPI00162A4B00|nr:DUF2752 domain-containing protein [Pontibacter sp. Tf4]MBB6611446.1 DUF2752 domain-containing protein [Pontibacter sp. Tf4]